MEAPFAQDVVHIADLEAAINYWRALTADAGAAALALEVAAPVEAYAPMTLQRRPEIYAEHMPDATWKAWLAWYDTAPDTPCIAICSTSQGDAICKGCGRTGDEVQHWIAVAILRKSFTRCLLHRVRS